ncbi:MAG: AAA family ATPase [Acidimicrobiia bacterium]|nr:AAA family ATPase [Acidimicrobiia bacterium]
MDPMRFFTTARVLIVAGKGGVGKTTVAAALATAAARNGATTLLVEIDGKTQLSDLFGGDELTYDDLAIELPDTPSGRLTAKRITPDKALGDYLEGRGLYRALRRLHGDKVLDTLASATPGVKDLLVLGKIKQLERAGRYDLIVVDAPASGHAITFLRAAEGVLDSVEAGPIREQAIEVGQMLDDPERCQVLLVTLAEETPVTELIDTAYRVEDEVGVKLGPLVVNALPARPPEVPTADELGGVDSDLGDALRGAVTFRRARAALQAEQLERLDIELPLPRLHLPAIETTPFGPAELDQLTDEMMIAIEAMPSADA